MQTNSLGDVIGSCEAISKTIEGIKSEKVQINLISSSVGPVVETDIKNAKVMNGITSLLIGRSSNFLLAKILAFGLKTPRNLLRLAQKEGVELQEFNIIYRLADYITDSLIGLLPVQISEKSIGLASVAQVFLLDKKEQVAGCRVEDGTILRSRERLNDSDRHFIQLVRNDKILWTGRIETMRHLKKEITSAGKGMDCGIILEGCTETILPGDKILCIERSPLKPLLQ